MRDRSLIDLDDFEIVDQPATSGEVSPSPGTRTPSETAQPETPRSVQELFDQHQATDPLQSVVKVVIKLSLPFALAWTTFVAVATSLYKQDSDELLSQHVIEDNTSVLVSHRERLLWAEQKLPTILEE